MGNVAAMMKNLAMWKSRIRSAERVKAVGLVPRLDALCSEVVFETNRTLAMFWIMWAFPCFVQAAAPNYITFWLLD